MFEPSPETYDAILSLRAVRGYTDEPIPDEVVEQILQAARWTGSSKNTQPWELVVVRDRERLDRLAGCGSFSTPILNAPLVIAPIRLPDGHDWDMGRLSQNMMLAAAALGVASCPVTLHREDCAREVLGVPADHGCRWVVAFGWPDQEQHREHRKRLRTMVGAGRKPLDDMVHHETFGG